MMLCSIILNKTSINNPTAITIIKPKYTTSMGNLAANFWALDAGL